MIAPRGSNHLFVVDSLRSCFGRELHESDESNRVVAGRCRTKDANDFGEHPPGSFLREKLTEGVTKVFMARSVE